MIVYIVRHAEVEPREGLSDKDKLFIGLSLLGKLQAKAVAKKLKRFDIDLILSSNLQRAKETAEIISNTAEIKVEYDDNLREFSADLDENDPKKQKDLKVEARSNPDKVMSSGESLNSAAERVRGVILNLGKSEYRSACVVTHRVVTEKFLANQFGINTKKSEWMNAAGLTAIEVDSNGIKKCIYFNSVYKDVPLFVHIVKRKISFILKEFIAKLGNRS